jgi:glyoxylase-like metal-dependent hydrolase (beta-lactamase superfamily II)
MKLHLSPLAACALFSGAANAGDLHVFTSDPAEFNTHSLWYDDGKEVTVVDAQFTGAAAQALLDDIRKQSK